MTESITGPNSVDEALLRLQAERIVLAKDKDGQVGNQKTKYADLVQANEVILPKLFALGLLWVTSPTLRMIAGPNGQEDPRFVLDWEMVHVGSGTKREGSYPLPAGANPMQNGSAITFARRYALLAITNAVADDDDDDGGGYRGRQGMAQRANVRQEQTRPTAQRADAPAPRAERAQPAQRPPLPEPASQRQPSAEPGEPVRGRGGLITEPMTKKLAISMKEIGAETGDDRKALIENMIGREVKSSKELTFDEGRAVIDAVVKAAATDNPLTSVLEIYQRTSGQQSPPAERPAPAERGARPSVREQTRAAVTGRPAGPGDEAPPWESEPPTLDGA
jgi:hypothetical protein